MVVRSSHNDHRGVEEGAPAHSPRSPSGADTWMQCLASVRMQAGLPDTSSAWSAQGTYLHRISSLCLEFGLDPFDFVGSTAVVDGFECEMERKHAVKMQTGIDRITDFGGEVFVEQRVSLEHWSKGDFGTLDIGIVTPKEIIIADWKWGAGEPVEVVKNRQLRIYALGFWRQIARHKTKARRFRLIIMQPMVEDGAFSEWVVDLDDLLEFGEEVREAAAETRKKNAPFKPSASACRWCKAFNDCKAAAKANLSLFGIKFDDLDAAADEGEMIEVPRIERLTPKQKAQIVLNMPMMRRWLDAVHADVYGLATSGDAPPGIKSVLGRKGPRQWDKKKKDKVKEVLRELLGARAFKKEMKSPTQIQEDGYLTAKQWRLIEEFIVQSDPKPILVPVTDKRKAVTPNAIEFGAVDPDDDE